MGVPSSALPDDSTYIDDSLAISEEIVNPAINQASAILYTRAVYNLGGSTLINIAPDQAGQTYFADLRNKLNINGFVSGVIQSAGDESTNQSMVVQEAAKNFTLANLQNLKDPYGRAYLAIAQTYGPNLWALA